MPIEPPSPEGLIPPSPDRITESARNRWRLEYEAAAAARRALLAASAPLWMRMLAWLPNPKLPLDRWIAAQKKRFRDHV
jgi:hypothetical protein